MLGYKEIPLEKEKENQSYHKQIQVVPFLINNIKLYHVIYIYLCILSAYLSVSHLSWNGYQHIVFPRLDSSPVDEPNL